MVCKLYITEFFQNGDRNLSIKKGSDAELYTLKW